MVAVSVAPPWQTADRPAARLAVAGPFAAAPRGLRLTVRLLLAGALAAVTTVYALRTFDLERKSYGEGPILATVERMRSEPISVEWLRAPDYTLSCYGPVYYWVFDLAARISHSPHGVIPGRLVSLAAAIAIAALATWVIARQTRSVELGLLAPLAFLVSPTVAYWMPYARVDMLALLAALGAYAALGPKPKSVAAAAALIAAGSLVKPTCALAGLPILAHLIVCRRWRDAVVFSLFVAALGAALWGVVQWSSRGFFLTGVLTGNRNQMIPWRGFAYGYEFLASPLGTAAMLVAVYLLVTEPASAVRSLWCLGFLLSLGISFVTVCKNGSDHNYFLDPALLASFVVAARGAPRLSAAQPRRALAALAGLAVVLTLPSAREIKVVVRSLGEPSEACARVRALLREEPANVGLLADGECVDLALAAGHRPWVNDSFLYMLLVANGTLDERELLDAMRQGRIKWLLLHVTVDRQIEKIVRKSRVWPEAVIHAMREHYELVEHTGETYVYRHRLPVPKPAT
ncbi:MAG TPA: hypothetical protein VMV69_26550 [Pirellulales bacterium]|nr:hypothetical protein [Pirellulales bacterium]